MRLRSPSSIQKGAGAASTATLILLSAEPMLAFQSSFVLPSAAVIHGGAYVPSKIAPATPKMDCAPWDFECYGESPFGHRRAEGVGGRRRRRGGDRGGGGGGGGRGLQRQSRFGSMAFAPPGIIQHRQLQMGDPAVIVDSDDVYTLSFDLPMGTDRDGLEVSVSDRLMTVQIRVTRDDDPRPSASRRGWVTRSSRTDLVARSFVLPESVSASSASVSLSADGTKAEVKFTKDKTADGATVFTATKPVASSTVDPAAGGAANKTKITPGPSTSPAGFIAGSSTSSTPSEPSSTGSAEAADSAAPRSPTGPESPFEALDQEFREFAKAVWGEDVLPRLDVPTKGEWAEQAAMAQETWAKREAEFAERFKAAKEARAKRVTAMRRATMASDISQAEDGSSYLVKIALPEGTTRDNVKLSVNPDRYLRVTASSATTEEDPENSVYKDVFLPRDALLSDISARFEAEQPLDGVGNNADEKGADEGGRQYGAGEEVSGLEVTVGRVAPAQPKSIDIV